ncbi:MAG: RluA family pseudouridine synthase, partial [Clostridia bacterium]|nr:RluA family pseudouridine synthase [Clostridia bacterium]
GMTVCVEVIEPEKISTEAEDIDFEIVYQDSDLAVINKPQGLVVHPCASTKHGTLVNGLLSKLKDLSGINGVLRPGIVHRLDKDTSGLLVVAKNDKSHVSLAEQIKNKTAHRNYLAVLEGNLKQDSGRVETFIKRDPKDRKKMSVQSSGRIAVTDFKVLKRFEKCCLVEFSLQTGRTHQIRVHAKHLGHPV